MDKQQFLDLENDVFETEIAISERYETTFSKLMKRVFEDLRLRERPYIYIFDSEAAIPLVQGALQKARFLDGSGSCGTPKAVMA